MRFILKISLGLFTVVAVFVHVLFYVITHNYLITSGLILIFIAGIIIYLCFLFIRKIFKLNYSLQDRCILIITVTGLLMFFELLLILTGHYSTNNEQNNVFYYSSPFIPSERGWLHIWSEDHDLCVNNNENCFHRTINKEGLSDINHPIFKPSNEFRILALGDSFTEGVGVDKDSTWLKYLEYSLRKYPIKYKLRFINAGICGSDPIFELKLLEKKLIKYKPDVVIVAINNTDTYDIVFRGGKERFKSNGKVKYSDPPAWEPIYACLHISRLVFRLFGYNEYFYKINSTKDNKAINEIWETIQELHEMSHKEHFLPIIVIHPGQSELKSKKLDLETLVDSLNKHPEIVHFDLMNYFYKNEGITPANSYKYYCENDGHNNASGYRIFAKGIEWKLLQIGLIDSLCCPGFRIK